MHWEMGGVAKALGTTERTLLRNKVKPLSKQNSENALEVADYQTWGLPISVLSITGILG